MLILLALLAPFVVLGLLVAMAAFERRMLGQKPGRTPPPAPGRAARGTRRPR